MIFFSEALGLRDRDNISTQIYDQLVDFALSSGAAKVLPRVGPEGNDKLRP